MTFPIGVPTDTAPGERRVATLPDVAEYLRLLVAVHGVFVTALAPQGERPALRLSRDTQEAPIDKQVFVGETLSYWSDQADQMPIGLPQVVG